MYIRSKRIVSDDSLEDFFTTCHANKIEIVACSTLGKAKNNQNAYIVKYISEKEI